MKGSCSNPPQHLTSPNPARLAQRDQLGRAVDAGAPGARLARAVGLHERLRRLRDARRAGSKVRCSSSSRPSPISRQSLSLQLRMRRSRCIVSSTSLPPGRSTRRICGQHLRVLLVAEVAERREQVQRRVEARVRERQLAVVGLGELRPALAAGAAAGLVEQRARAVHADDAVARAGERRSSAGRTRTARRAARRRLGAARAAARPRAPAPRPPRRARHRRRPAGRSR